MDWLENGQNLVNSEQPSTISVLSCNLFNILYKGLGKQSA